MVVLSAKVVISIFIAGVCAGNALYFVLSRGVPVRLPKHRKSTLLKLFYRERGIRALHHMAIALFSGGLAVFTAQKYGVTLYSLCCFLIFLTLLAISLIDAEHMVIPDVLVLALAALAICLILLQPSAVNALSRISGFFSLSIPMLILTLIVPNAFGGGDIKLIAVCGLLLGLKAILLAGFMALVFAGAYGFYIKYIVKRGDTYIAFGQFICAGVFISMTYGNKILLWYLEAFI